MSKAKLISEILEVSERTIFRWKKENKLVTDLLDKYFTDDDLNEFIKTRKINRFELCNDFSYIISEKINRYEMKFIFSISHYGIHFIEMLNNLFDGKLHKQINNNIYNESFFFEISNDEDYLRFLNYVFDTKFKYFYNKLNDILIKYPEPIIKEFFIELKKTINN